MRKYLIVVELTAGFPCYYESLSRNALDHIKRENYYMLNDNQAFRAFGAKSVDVVDLASNRIVSSASVETVSGKRKCCRKSQEAIRQLNENIEAYLKRIRDIGIKEDDKREQPRTANG